MARVLTEEELWDICRTAAMTVVGKYGIKDVGKFVKALMAVAMAESSGDAESVHDNGQGFGLFAEHNQGYANYLSKEQRLDPQQNANAAAMQLGRLWKDADPFETNVQRMTGPEGQNPADPVALARNALTAGARFVGSVVGGAGQVQAAGTTEQGGTTADFVQWLKDHGFGGYIWTDPKTGEEVPDNVPTALINAFLDETTGAAGQTPLEEAQTAQIWQNIGDYSRVISLDEREQKRKEEETWINEQIAAGTADENTWQRAVDRFTAWYNATGEARLRAEKEFDVAEKRAAFTRPAGTYTRPAHKQVMEQYGLTYTPEQGIPVEQLPNLEETYGKWQQNLGVSQNAPAMAGVSTGPTAAQAFIQDLLQKHAMRTGGLTLPAMGGGGWMARDEPFIAGEEGPEVIQPTDTGTAVTPIGAGVGLRRYAGGRKPFPRRPIATVAPAPVPTGRTQPYATELAAFMSDFERQYGRRPGATEVYSWWSQARNQPYTPSSTNPAYAQQAYRNWLTSRRAA